MADRKGTVTKLANGKWRLDYPGQPSAEYLSDTAAYNRRLRLDKGYQPSKVVQKTWEPHEDERLRSLWNGKNNTKKYVVSLFPGRSYLGIKCRAKTLGLNVKRGSGADHSRSPQPLWTAPELEILIRHQHERSIIPRLLPKRSPEAILIKMRGLNLIQHRQRWSEEDERAVRTVLKAKARLESRYNRSTVNDKIRRTRVEEQSIGDMLSAVKSAVPAYLPTHIREDVHHSLLLAVMEDRGLMDNLQDAAKRIITKTYGPRTYSLDAPVFDGSGMSWIDTIESERPHF